MKINAFSLNSVNSAIKKLKNRRDNLEINTKNSIQELTKKGYEFMISVVREDTGELKNSITWEFNETKQKGVIKVGADYGIFIEYGTGIVGANSPHPNAKGWRYDINNHGQKGWWYFDEKQNRYRWARGQSANAFVYKTFKFLEKEAGKGITVKMNG